jgi:ubiquitin
VANKKPATKPARATGKAMQDKRTQKPSKAAGSAMSQPSKKRGR